MSKTLTELELVEWIRKRAGRSRQVALGIGDDCAVIRQRPGEDLLFTTDLLIEDVHFRHDTHSAADCGHKALARGLSDIAAMGGEPRFCFLSLAAGSKTDARWIERFFDGLLALAKSHRCVLAGGDLGHGEKTVADIFVGGAVPSGEELRRDGARPGDSICVSGALGVSAFGLETKRGMAWKRHLRPEPRVKLGLALRKLGATSAMDLSDGLSIDLHRLAKASRITAALDGELPVFHGATIGQALHGGEDYELLFTLPGGSRIPGSVAGIPITRIGEMMKGPPGQVRVPGGILQPLGYDHFRK